MKEFAPPQEKRSFFEDESQNGLPEWIAKLKPEDHEGLMEQWRQAVGIGKKETLDKSELQAQLNLLLIQGDKSDVPDVVSIAKAVNRELYAFNTDESFIYSELKKLKKNSVYIEYFIETYRHLFDVSVVAELYGELDSDEIEKALDLLRPEHESVKKNIRGEWMDLKSYSKATNFKELVTLIRVAEDKLINKGYYELEDRIEIFRGIYYGTEWSMDYGKEHSDWRNLGFKVFTSNFETPINPIEVLGESLFNALKEGPEVRDGDRSIDIGHVMIGLEARTNRTAREINVPATGGTGLELNTWLGDLGGGVGMTSFRRARGEKVSAKSVVFIPNGNDYGCKINLEGDIASYVIGRDKKEDDGPSYPELKKYTYISDAIADYLMLKDNKPSDKWAGRVKTFAKMVGAKFDAQNNITNKSDLINSFQKQMAQFGDFYISIREIPKGNLSPEKALETAKHLNSVANEVAQIFVDILEQYSKDSTKKLVANISPEISKSGEPYLGKLMVYYYGNKGINKIKDKLK